MENACWVWEVVIAQHHEDYAKDLTRDDVMKTLSEYCKKWTFQLERGEETGYLHFQGRVSLIKKRRQGEFAKLFNHTWGFRGKVLVTAKENYDKEAFYCMKADTRVEGPWKETDYWQRPPKTPQLNFFNERGIQPWMNQIIRSVKEQDWNMREINIVINHSGNMAKSLFCEYMEYEGLGFEVPPINSFDDMMQAVHGVPPQKCYLVDMPRAMDKRKLQQFFSGIEYLKNGVTYDKRYAFKKRRMARPHIWVFTNSIPKKKLLSADRWVLWQFTEKVDGLHLEVFKYDEDLEDSDED